MATQRILITVKTYPTLSKTYGELVCTAGLDEEGRWIRLYPIPFRDLDTYQRYKKYEFIEAELERNRSDPRPESHKVRQGSIKLTGERLGTKDAWESRRQWILDRHPVHENLTGLIAAANETNSLSLATFKPTKILDFVVEEESREWDAKKLAAIRAESQQGVLFEEFVPRSVDQLVRKLPYKFSYRFEDNEGRSSKLMIEDWEIGALYWNCLRAADGDEEVAVSKVREKYFDSFTKTDLHLFLGTTREWHGRGKNPFVIIGVFPPPKVARRQQELF